MDIKNELKQIVSFGGKKRFHILRYLKKNNPKLWDEMIRLTSFLPDTASAPQRTWHIINKVNVIPKCPETNVETKWISYDKGYTTYASRTASRPAVAQTLSEVTSGKGHWRNKDAKKAKQANKKYSNGIKSGRIVVDRSKRDAKASYEKAAKTCLERYGVDNYWKSVEFKAEQKEYYDEKFKEVRASRSERDKYYEEVGYYTEKNWNEHFYKINPSRQERGPDLHLDHIFSRAEGFKRGIAAEVIGHWTNLRLISRLENSSKRHRCDKTEKELFEDFQNAK